MAFRFSSRDCDACSLRLCTAAAGSATARCTACRARSNSSWFSSISAQPHQTDARSSTFLFFYFFEFFCVPRIQTNKKATGNVDVDINVNVNLIKKVKREWSFEGGWGGRDERRRAAYRCGGHMTVLHVPVHCICRFSMWCVTAADTHHDCCAAALLYLTRQHTCIQYTVHPRKIAAYIRRMCRFGPTCSLRYSCGHTNATWLLYCRISHTCVLWYYISKDCCKLRLVCRSNMGSCAVQLLRRAPCLYMTCYIAPRLLRRMQPKICSCSKKVKQIILTLFLTLPAIIPVCAISTPNCILYTAAYLATTTHAHTHTCTLQAWPSPR